MLHFFIYKFYIGYSFGNFTPEIKFFIRFSQERIFHDCYYLFSFHHFFGMTAPWKMQLKTEKCFYLQIHDLTMKIRMFDVENATFL